MGSPSNIYNFPNGDQQNHHEPTSPSTQDILTIQDFNDIHPCKAYLRTEVVFQQTL